MKLTHTIEITIDRDAILDYLKKDFKDCDRANFDDIEDFRNYCWEVMDEGTYATLSDGDNYNYRNYFDGSDELIKVFQEIYLEFLEDIIGKRFISRW